VSEGARPAGLPCMLAGMRKALFLAFAAAGVASNSFFGPGCVDVAAGTGGGGAGGGDTVAKGELCTPPNVADVKIRAQPATVFLPTCAAGTTGCTTRKVKLIVDPDLCPAADGQTAPIPVPATLSLTSGDAGVAPAPLGGIVGLHEPTLTIDVKGGAKPGSTTLTAHLPTSVSSTKEVTGSIDVEVLDPTPIDCSKATAAEGMLHGDGKALLGAGSLAGASITLQKGAENPNGNAFLWHVDPFDATITCAADTTPAGYVAIGPAVTFGPAALVFKREIPFSIPVNPALMPAAARLRHLKVVYSSPAFQKPRAVPVADPRIEKVNGQWALTFKAPRLGTYQVVVATDAGTKTHKRKLTHRAVIGISMGGGGTATFGMRHHNLFDVLAPLGGPGSWTWLLDYIENNHLGGFRPIPKGTTLKDIPLTAAACQANSDCKPDETCLGKLDAPAMPGKCTLMPAAPDPYLHPQTFNNWWYEYPRSGNGGTFARGDYAQIFRDLALMYGNPNGDNLAPNGENLPAGVPPDDLSVLGDHKNGECRVWLDPLDGPDHDKQQMIADTCPKERCAHTLSLQNYFDDEYNPDGIFPVITICDGNSQQQQLTPYSNTWHPDGNDYPLEVGLAVDYNGNGVRDELEPVIRAGHEPWRDDGADGVPSAKEAGFDPAKNPDPAGDDYDSQFNPAGTEGDHRLTMGEAFDDFGLDGVPGTKQQPAGGYLKPGDGYDVGEGDQKFTVPRGLQRFWDRDAYSIVRKMVDPAAVPGGELTDEALGRIDLWTDGGTRDLFNFGVDAQHLVGGFAARGRDVAYLTDFAAVPGLDPASPDYVPSHVQYDDMQGVIFQRYGHIDPSPTDVDDGSGQHVGTGTEAVKRIQSALYFIGSRWREPELLKQHSPSSDNPDPKASECEVLGSCTIDFTSKAGRVGPIGITLPPGYANADLLNVRYPVIYMLHGYGQSPQDLEALVALVGNWMNNPLDSGASRLPKAILVYVDGRCRVGPSGKPECLRGTFFADSVKPDGAQDESWWLELMDYVDQHYRTLGERDVDWTE
jgi:hypothetical protein